MCSSLGQNRRASVAWLMKEKTKNTICYLLPWLQLFSSLLHMIPVRASFSWALTDCSLAISSGVRAGAWDAGTPPFLYPAIENVTEAWNPAVLAESFNSHSQTVIQVYVLHLTSVQYFSRLLISLPLAMQFRPPHLLSRLLRQHFILFSWVKSRWN